MRDLDGWMRQLAQAAREGDPTGHVFTMRKVLTEVWRDGHDAGYRDANQDETVARHIAQQAAEKGPSDA